MYPEYKLVQQCLQLIESQLQWGPSDQWHNDVYIELSELIHGKTQVLLSPTTLKRVWGRLSYNSVPSISTRNALARFAGFQNWRDFKSRQKAPKPSGLFGRISANIGVITLAASVMTLVFISFYSLRGVENTPIDPSVVEFSSEPITKGLPNSVVFKLNLENVASNDILIQQSWDETKTIRVKKGQTEATGQYYYPGYFRSKLRIDGNIVKEHDLFIKSEGWLGTLDYEPIPKYVPEVGAAGATLSLPPDVLREVAESEEPLISAFHYVNDFGPISGDHFIFETSIRNVYRDKWAVCQRVNILILGTKSALIIPFSIPGCISELGVMLSERYLDGKQHDLSGLGIDFSDFRDIRIEVRDKSATVYADDTLLFRHAFSASIGNVAGIRYRFKGAGEVARVRLTDLDGGTVALDEVFGP